MKATELLKSQHREVEKLFAQIEGTDDPGERMELAETIKSKLEVHATIEEEIFYPAFRDGSDTNKAEEAVLEAYEEHHVVKLVLAEIPDLDASAETFQAKMTVLKELIEHHVEEEEDEMFRDAEKKLGNRRLEQLGEEMEARAVEIDADGRDEGPEREQRV
jgi:hypothetical protein